MLRCQQRADDHLPFSSSTRVRPLPTQTHPAMLRESPRSMSGNRELCAVLSRSPRRLRSQRVQWPFLILVCESVWLVITFPTCCKCVLGSALYEYMGCDVDTDLFAVGKPSELLEPLGFNVRYRLSLQLKIFRQLPLAETYFRSASNWTRDFSHHHSSGRTDSFALCVN
jgi:hypothetical protein